MESNQLKHPTEAEASWTRFEHVSSTNRAFTPSSDSNARRQLNLKHQSAVEIQEEQVSSTKRASIPSDRPHHRNLKHHHHYHESAKDIELQKEEEFWKDYLENQKENEEMDIKQKRKHNKRVQELYAYSGIEQETVHGIMIDAGSTGSRLHVYEWEPRVLQDERDIQAAVSGEKLSFPGTESRWTDRLRPGLASFGSIQDDDELQKAVADYLKPLMDFAVSVLHSKADRFAEFPIFLRATAGMRILNPTDRARVITAVRNLFHDPTYSPFAFVDEQARVLSGEEEAVFDWTGVNFLMGDLVNESEGAGTVVNPRLTHGALDLGGGSTQISFYEPHEDIMSNLFKLQIGQAKHWNIYAHSFLFYGMNEAIHRFNARLTAGKSRSERLIDDVYNPCLPVGSKQDVRTDIHLSSTGVETWNYTEEYPSGDGFFQAILVNNRKEAEVDKCLDMATDLLHLEKNDWCEFAHGDCSLAGVYQPALPSKSTSQGFGEFVAFSNYYHIWQFLHLPERATLYQLENATRHACALTHEELVAFNDGVVEDEAELDTYCFRSAYALQLLRKGYGFQMNDTIRVTKVIHGQKVGWALGAMLYEINTMPWSYVKQDDNFILDHSTAAHSFHMKTILLVTVIFGMIAVLLVVFIRRERKLRRMYEYEPIKEVEVESVSV